MPGQKAPRRALLPKLHATNHRYPVMTEIVEILEKVTENAEEWVVPEPLKLDPKTVKQPASHPPKVPSFLPGQEFTHFFLCLRRRRASRRR